MTKHNLTELKNCDISQDGRTIALNFADENDRPVSLSIPTLSLEKTHHDIGQVITKARQLSDISKQGIIPFQVASGWRATVMVTDRLFVLISFRFDNGLEMHYGIPATAAGALAESILEAARQGISTKPQSSH
jgi:hypothetical protein